MRSEDLERLRQRAAHIASIPPELRNAKRFGRGFEDRAVRRLCTWLGVTHGPLHEVRKQYGHESLRFDHLHEAVPGLPIRFAAGSLKFHFAGIAGELFNAFVQTPMWDAYSIAREQYQDELLGLVFHWPGIRKCQGLCILHNVANLPAPDDATRLQRRVRGLVYTIEPVPSLLTGLGLLAGVSDTDDEIEFDGPEEEEEDNRGDFEKS